jgi:anti-sigma regulatory factor (Ser/Thr protein kinase)
MSRRATEQHTGRARLDPPQSGGEAALHIHEALFYRNQQEYLDGLREFFAPALAAGEPVAIAVPKAKFGVARQALNGAEHCELLDMEELGRNPGRIIPAVERMLHKYQGQTLHYVGEPIWPGRSPAEITEAVRHEALINIAWAGQEVRVLCPYDVRGLDEEVLRSAEQTHPTVVFRGEVSDSQRYRTAPPPECELPLPPPPAEAAKLEFGREDLARVRTLAADQGTKAGLTRERVDDLVIVANELASNALQHGWPPRRVAVWPEQPQKIVCEVTNWGAIDDPLAGRRNPSAEGDMGMGLWIVHHLCELVEVRTGESTTVRAHLATG